MAVKLAEREDGGWATSQVTVRVVKFVRLPNIENQQALSSDINTLNAIAECLSMLYPDRGDQQRIVFFAGAELTATNFNTSSIDYWFQIIEDLNDLQKIDTLLNIALSEYSDNQKLKQIANLWEQNTVRTTTRKSKSSNNKTMILQESHLTHDLILALREITIILSDLYDDKASSLRMVEEAGLDPIYIDFSGSSLVIWYRIIKRANELGKVSNLLSVAKNEYLHNSQLRSAEMHWLGAVTNNENVHKITNDKESSSNNRLISILASLYLDKMDQRRIVDEAQLNRTFVNFDGSAITVWSRILSEAEKRGKFEDIIKVVQNEYPERSNEITAAKRIGY